MSHVVKTIKIKRGAKMHILANGAGRNLRSTIMNHLNIRIMKEVHYIWIDFESSTGSYKSILLRNGCFSLDGAKKFIKSLSPKTLYENRPTFLKDCVKITLTAQNIFSSNTLYRRTINILA